MSSRILAVEDAEDFRRILKLTLEHKGHQVTTAGDGAEALEVLKDAQFDLIISDGLHLSIASETVTLAYSNQLMEHLHPDDALDQLQLIFEVLAPNGQYVCVTPNRLYGPHDISKFFDDVATGFHLKEYTATDLADIFESVGFAGVHFIANIGGRYLACPTLVMRSIERLFESFPMGVRRRLARISVVGGVLGTVIVGRKNP